MYVFISPIFLDWRLLKGRDHVLYMSSHISYTVSWMGGWKKGEGERRKEDTGKNDKQKALGTASLLTREALPTEDARPAALLSTSPSCPSPHLVPISVAGITQTWDHCAEHLQRQSRACSAP